MGWVSDSPVPSSSEARALRPSTIGLLFCLGSAVLYAGTNICLRQLSASCQPGWAIWIVCIKESVSALVVGPWLIYRLVAGRQPWPSRRSVLWLLAAGLTTQLGGNVFNFWAFGVVGLAVTTPVTQGTNLISSAVLGWVLLRERVSLRSMAAIGMLIVAIVLLSLGAADARHVVPTAGSTSSQFLVALGVGAACLSGIAFSVLGTAIRRTVTQATSPAVVVVMITGMGTLILGPLSAWKLGLSTMCSISPASLALAVTAGLLNLVAFSGIIYGLKHTTIIHAYVVNSSQTAFAALAGMLVFGESLSPALLVGVGMIMGGMVIIDGQTGSGEAGAV
jgi:drug/metabolite transporter (DMT)-like permease